MLDGVFRIARMGQPWHELHGQSSKWDSVYRQFCRWTLTGVWDVLLAVLDDSGEGQDRVLMIARPWCAPTSSAAGPKESSRPEWRKSWPVAL